MRESQAQRCIARASEGGGTTVTVKFRGWREFRGDVEGIDRQIAEDEKLDERQRVEFRERLADAVLPSFRAGDEAQRTRLYPQLLAELNRCLKHLPPDQRKQVEVVTKRATENLDWLGMTAIHKAAPKTRPGGVKRDYLALDDEESE